MCRIALISWPISKKSPKNFYINLGEIYDKKIQEDITILSQFHRETAYLYPFRYKDTCYNIEDFNVFRKRYGLTIRHRLVGNIPKEKVITFRSPVLYDISCMVPLFRNTKSIPKKYYPISKACIVLPTLNPIIRGHILNEVIINRPEFIVLAGKRDGKNHDSTATLMTRYLRKRGVPMKNIFKIQIDKKPECILDALELLEMINIPMECPIVVACSHEDINIVQRTVRKWRRKGVIDKKISYYCSFY
jgi:hypothetical protein